MRVLVIEDNAILARGMEIALHESGLNPECCPTAAEGEEKASSGKFDVIILDRKLPDGDGLSICKSLRRRKVATPILFLSGLAEATDKINGLDAGADDYLAKPFEMKELIARVRSVYRRSEVEPAGVLECGDLRLNLRTRLMTRGDKEFPLVAREFELMSYLLRNQDRVLTRSQIGQGAWATDLEPDSNLLEVYISALRKKIEQGGQSRLIHTARGTGYRVSARA